MESLEWGLWEWCWPFSYKSSTLLPDLLNFSDCSTRSNCFTLLKSFHRELACCRLFVAIPQLSQCLLKSNRKFHRVPYELPYPGEIELFDWTPSLPIAYIWRYFRGQFFSCGKFLSISTWIAKIIISSCWGVVTAIRSDMHSLAGTSLSVLGVFFLEWI